MKEYDELVSSLINAPLSQRIRGNNEKLATIYKYATELFGGKIIIPSIVVAGTKGKGSTCAIAESVLRHSGLKTGLFTSPHLVTPRERIKIDGKSISEEEYLETFHRLDLLLKDKKLPRQSFFAMHSLMASLVFLNRKVDAAVIECGVGGRYDWTKIFDPSVSAVTRLEYDHIDTLGKWPGSITWHKAGIFTDKSISLTIPQSPEFRQPLILHAKNQGANLIEVQPHWRYKLGIRGPCAEENAALGAESAKSLAKILGVNNVNVIDGASNCEIAGRFHELNKDGVRWLLDGAHTQESLSCCKEWYESMSGKPEKNILICSTTKLRNPNSLLKALASMIWKNIYYVSSYNESFNLNNSIKVNTIQSAIKRAVAEKPESVLVTGSMHLVGDCLKELNWKPN